MVDIGNQAHGHRGMTIVTLFGRPDVIAGLRGRRHESALFVAVGTVLRRSLKDALDVTLLTVQLFVGARQRKPGREMVKLTCTLLGLRRSDASIAIKATVNMAEATFRIIVICSSADQYVFP